MSALNELHETLDCLGWEWWREFMGGGIWVTVARIDGSETDVLVIAPSETRSGWLDVTRMPQSVLDYGDVTEYGEHTLTVTAFRAARLAAVEWE